MSRPNQDTEVRGTHLAVRVVNKGPCLKCVVVVTVVYKIVYNFTNGIKINLLESE